MCTLDQGQGVFSLDTETSVLMPRPRPAVTVLCSLIFPDLEVTDWEKGPTLPTISFQGSPSQIWESQTLCFCPLS